MPWRVQEVTALPDYRLSVRFIDGTVGTVDLAKLIASPEAGEFARLREPTAFGCARVEHGAVTWPGELDLAPDAMHAAILRDGEWKIPA
jgi:hypothetical protein